jgi:hypothetical protein
VVLPDVFFATTLTSFTVSCVTLGCTLASSVVIGDVTTSWRDAGAIFFGETVFAVFVGLTVCATGSFFVTFGDVTVVAAGAAALLFAFTGLAGDGLLSSTTAGFLATSVGLATTGSFFFGDTGSFLGVAAFSTAGFCGDFGFTLPFCLLSFFCGLDGAAALVAAVFVEAAEAGAAAGAGVSAFFGAVSAGTGSLPFETVICLPVFGSTIGMGAAGAGAVTTGAAVSSLLFPVP